MDPMGAADSAVGADSTNSATSTPVCARKYAILIAQGSSVARTAAAANAGRARRGCSAIPQGFVKAAARRSARANSAGLTGAEARAGHAAPACTVTRPGFASRSVRRIAWEKSAATTAAGEAAVHAGRDTYAARGACV